MRIEKPSWRAIHPNIKEELDKWFNTHVEPINEILSNGVEVMCADRDTCNWWSKLDDDVAWHSKALLINIQPIKKETAEERYRNALYNLVDCICSGASIHNGALAEAKAVLGE